MWRGSTHAHIQCEGDSDETIQAHCTTMKPSPCSMCTHTLEVQPESGDICKVRSFFLCDPFRLPLRAQGGHAVPQECLAHHVRLDRIVKVAHVLHRIPWLRGAKHRGAARLRRAQSESLDSAHKIAAHHTHGSTTEVELRLDQTMIKEKEHRRTP